MLRNNYFSLLSPPFYRCLAVCERAVSIWIVHAEQSEANTIRTPNGLTKG